MSEMDRRQAAERKIAARNKKVTVAAAFALLSLLFGLIVWVVMLGGSGGGGGKGGTTSGNGEGNQTGDGKGDGVASGNVSGSASSSNMVTASPPVTPTTVPPEPETSPIPFNPVTNFMLIANSPPLPPEQPPPGESGGGRDAGSGGGRGGGGRSGKPMGTGDISFRMFWEPPVQDIDLHVIDPSGHHTWYQAKRCPCQGELDRDDTTSGGPENIYWPKDQGPAGEYTYYALYYAGSGFKRVTIQVRQGDTILTTKRFALDSVGQESEHFIHSLIK